MGLIHEHQRPGVTLCTREQTSLTNCTKCSDSTTNPAAETCTLAEATACYGRLPPTSTVAVTFAYKTRAEVSFQAGMAECQACATGTCTVGCPECEDTKTFWGCYREVPNTTSTTNGLLLVSEADRNNAVQAVNDRKTVSDALFLTHSDPMSIMHYCRGENGAVDNGIPTTWDMLGMEMLYSANRLYGLGCGRGCFSTSSGVVTTNSGSVVSEWIARGSLNVPFRVGTGSYVYSYSVAGLPAGASTFAYNFRDAIGNTRNGSGTVIRSNTRFAAIAHAAIEML
jgi:hypothetical protein